MTRKYESLAALKKYITPRLYRMLVKDLQDLNLQKNLYENT